MLASTTNYLARTAQDHSCAHLNERVGVDDCAEGPYCIDTDKTPTRCVDLEDSTTCFHGREKGSKICVY